METIELKKATPELYTEWPQDLLPKLIRHDWRIIEESGTVLEKIGDYWVEFYINITPVPYRAGRFFLDDIEDLTIYRDFKGEVGAMVESSWQFDEEVADQIYDQLINFYYNN